MDLRILALYEEIGKPGANKLYLAAKERRIPLSQAKAREFIKTDESAQTYAPAPHFGGKVVSSSVNDRWAADLIDQKANRGAGGESAALVVQDIFSRRIFARALQGKSASEVSAAFQSIMDTAGTPRELNTDSALEWTGAFAQLLRAKGIAHRLKPTGDASINDLATLDAAIGNARSTLGRLGAGKHWPQKLHGVVEGISARPHSGTLCHAPNNVATNEDIQFAPRQRAARDVVISAQSTHYMKARLVAAGAARPLLNKGTWPKRRAANATWGERATVVDISSGIVTTTNGVGPIKAFRAALGLPRTRLRGKQPG